MNKKTVFLILFATMAGSARAEATHWVRDRIVVSVRNAPGSDGKVLHSISSGTGMRVLEQTADGTYARVALNSGLEGWVGTRYLVNKPIAAARLAKMEKEWEQFKKENVLLKKNLDEFKELDKDLEVVHRLRDENTKLTSEIERFREINMEPMALANENEQLRNKNVANDKQIQMMRQELQIVKDRSDRDWFLLGAGVLIIGILMGIVFPRLRVKKKNGWDL